MTIVYIIGFLAQIFFSARILVQWILSEKAKEIVSPSIFWVLSIAGSYLLFIYGWCRDDFSIILGQIISYYIYIWNLNAKGIWRNINIILRIILFITPVVACTFLLESPEQFVSQFFRNENIPIWLLVFGSAGQVIFTLRFIYQLIYSYHKHESKLPIGFWIISLIGSSIIVSYGIFRLDPVLILGQSVGFIAYIRNIILGVRKNKSANLEHK